MPKMEGCLMSELAAFVKDYVPRNFNVGGTKETAAITDLCQKLSQMTGRQIRIHTGKPSANVVELLVAFEPLLLDSMKKVGAETLFIASSNQVQASQLERGFKNNHKLRHLTILASKGRSSKTIGVAITNLEEACDSRNKVMIEKALRTFQLNLAEFIKTTLVFVL